MARSKTSCLLLLSAVWLGMLLSSCSQQRFMFGRKGEPAVVLDIGHHDKARGAYSPGRVKGRRLNEYTFWHENAQYTRRVVEEAGYPCVICNRGDEPEDERLRTLGEQAGVEYLGRPDDSDSPRYRSYYSRDRVSAGIISADYAVYRQAPAAVFLHHNSSGCRWNKRRRMPSLIITNRYNGTPLATSIARELDRRVLNHGLPNGGQKCSVQVRCVDASRAAGWMNVCDDAGIPAAVIEAAFLNNRRHAAWLADEQNARRYAEAVGHGIVAYLREQENRTPHIRADHSLPDEGTYQPE